MKIIAYSITLLFVVLLASPGYTQTMTSLKIMPGGIYPLPNDNNSLSSKSLDSAGKFVIEPGVILSYQAFHTSGDVALKVMQGAYKDGMGMWAGFSHLEVRAKLWTYYRHSIEIGIGPTLHFRQTWDSIPGYQNEGYFRDSQGWQYRMSWLSGEVEYNFGVYNKKKQRVDLSVSLNHHARQGLTVGIGARYWLSKNKKRGPCMCPSTR